MTRPAPEVSILLCLKTFEYSELKERLDRLYAVLEGHVDYEVILVGYGDPEISAFVSRSLSDTNARVRFLLHTRPSPALEAFAAGVRFAAAPKIVYLVEIGENPREGDVARGLWSLATRPHASLDCIFVGPRDPLLFDRNAFLALPVMPYMHRLLPEVLEFAGRAVWEASVSGQSGLAWSPIQRRLRRLAVAVWRKMRGTLDRNSHRGVS